VQEAVAAQAAVDHFKFDKSHVLRTYLVDTLDKLAATPEEYSAPAAQPFDEQVPRPCFWAAAIRWLFAASAT
jgi:hypothetical protein